MGLTRAERHNRMLDRVFEQKKQFDKDPVMKSIKKHRAKIGEAYHYKGDQYPGGMSKAHVPTKAMVLKNRTK